MTERLPTYAIEAITDAATQMMRMRDWLILEGRYDSEDKDKIDPVIDNLNQIIDGQAALKQPWPQPADVQDLPFAMGETS